MTISKNMMDLLICCFRLKSLMNWVTVNNLEFKPLITLFNYGCRDVDLTKADAVREEYVPQFCIFG